MKNISLHGLWSLQRTSTSDLYKMEIPGDTISALIAEQVIEDPYLGCNELDVQWIGKEEWKIERTISLDSDLINNNTLYLQLESIDTIADIYCNGVQIGSCENMFTSYRFPLHAAAKEGVNTITILFHSAEQVAFQRNESLSYPVEHSVYPVQSMHRNLVRKAQCHAGWDWGPSLMTSGIYGEISILATPMELIDVVHTNISKEGSSWRVEIHTLIESAANGKTELAIALHDQSIKESVHLHSGLNEFIHTIVVTDVNRWWPIGYGEQTLYTLEVSSSNDKKTKSIGFREIEVNTTPDEKGIPMTFVVNGVPIFAKGANWIPMDALPSRYSDKRYEELLQSAADAHMNMIRVWGGGHYEQDIFYQLCDQKGILVWQDCMFACSLYPSTSWFLDSVRKEIEHQVLRLKDHPSLALWCGNNEDVGALTWFESSRENRDRYIIDYDRLNEGVLGETIKRLDPNRKWWSSSPLLVKEIIVTAGTTIQKVICTIGVFGMRVNLLKHIKRLSPGSVQNLVSNHFPRTHF